MKAHFNLIWQLTAALGLMVLAGCSVVPEPQADLTRYYVLGDTVAESGTSKTSSGLVIGLSNVQLPAYLDKGAVVVRRAGNELVYNDYARWAEPLADGLGRIVRGQLLASPRVSRVFTEGFPFDQKRDCDVTISIERCEGVDLGGQFVARFVATIEITSTKTGGGVLGRKVFAAPETAWDGRDYGALVQMLGQAAASLGDEVVATLPEK
jgi:uncharacterized protein